LEFEKWLVQAGDRWCGGVGGKRTADVAFGDERDWYTDVDDYGKYLWDELW
jgi:hypothetical protein